MKQKVFGIGHNKTGTTSLSIALNQLGIKTLHDVEKIRKSIKYEKENNLKLLSTLKEFQGFVDEPINRIYKELDKAYPNSKFIFTTRKLSSWLKSRENHVLKNQQNPDYKGEFLKIDKINWINEWIKHNEQVKEYFKNRPNDLLIITICEGEGWEKLCPFLGLEIPNKPFPHENNMIIDENKKTP
ncbi:MAG: sulfotransferase family protein [archaeon]